MLFYMHPVQYLSSACPQLYEIGQFSWNLVWKIRVISRSNIAKFHLARRAQVLLWRLYDYSMKTSWKYCLTRNPRWLPWWPFWNSISNFDLAISGERLWTSSVVLFYLFRCRGGLNNYMTLEHPLCDNCAYCYYYLCLLWYDFVDVLDFYIIDYEELWNEPIYNWMICDLTQFRIYVMCSGPPWPNG